MPKIVNYTNARDNLRTLITQVNQDSDIVTVTTKNNENAIIISEDDYRSMEETMYLNQSPANAKHLQRSLQSFENNNTHKVTIDV
ncbi:TPA: type II toxin-antitoxin system prevent-host-death family antitoxin [Staphylococcus aureus]|uniref:type II toxin-antitoxin system Phd/YefM family antitoxin n=1 Tax=Staphylococcus warneri TaxID=1292 RepID=UPI00214AD5A8|nr:type II toxin-antitoxin system prevent-host-death family antitoxin [Staphylococcus warneri]MCR1798258.1 type II toxin-antitoxin system prevent-host-death family antitoxin [Staphylococcus warneri]HCU8763894.1 type II toxin-antitoxin system prevent-host-death family antitoxin [Staphylococcus aureus]